MISLSKKTFSNFFILSLVFGLLSSGLYFLRDNSYFNQKNANAQNVSSLSQSSVNPIQNILDTVISSQLSSDINYKNSEKDYNSAANLQLPSSNDINSSIQSQTTNSQLIQEIKEFGITTTSTNITITVPSSTNNDKPIISGTCQAGKTVGIFVYKNGVTSYLYSESITPFVCAATGTFSVSPSIALPDGPFLVQGTDLAGNTGTANAKGVIDTSTSVTIVVPALTKNNKPTITGTCEAGSSVVVSVFKSAANILSEDLPVFVCNANGLYSINTATILPDGAFSARAVATDPSTNTATTSNSGIIDTTTNVTINVPVSPTTSKPTITGTCEAGATLIFKFYKTEPTITSYILTETSLPLICPANGNYTVLPTVSLNNAAYLVQVVTTDLAGNIANTEGQGIINATYFVSILVPEKTANSLPPITGTCISGSNLTIEIYNGKIANIGTTSILSETLPSFVCSASGSYATTPTIPLPLGDFFASIVSIQGANTATDLSEGVIKVLSPTSIKVPELTSIQKPTITGTCKEGSIIDVRVFSYTFPILGDANLVEQFPAFTCDATEIFTLTPNIDIPYGQYGADVYSNYGLASEEFDVSYGLIDANVAVTILVPALTNDNTPPITGTCVFGGNLGGVTIWHVDDAGTFIASEVDVPVTCQANGTFSLSPTIPLIDGRYDVAASAYAVILVCQDVCFNDFKYVYSYSSGVIDTVTNVTTVVPAISSNPKPIVSGICEPLANLTVNMYQGTLAGIGSTSTLTETKSLICSATGTYSVLPSTPLVGGYYAATTVASDALGNLANSSAQGLIDTNSANSTITILVPALTNDNKPTITGTCKSGNTISIFVFKSGVNNYIYSESIAPFVCNSTNTYSVIPSIILPDGNFLAQATDLSSNNNAANDKGIVKTSTFITVTVPTISNNPKPSITGTCDTGATVTIAITSGSPLNNTLQNITPFICVGGTYSLTPPADIPNGNYCANATIVDLASNTATAIPSCGVIDTFTTVTILVPPITNNPKPPIAGTCEPTANLVITVTPTNEIINLVCPTSGNYTTNPANDIPDGNYCGNIKATDLAGNIANAQGCGVVDTSTFVTISVPALTNNPKPTASGTCSYGDSLAIVFTPTNQLISTICPQTGTYSVNPTINIPDGNYSAGIVATDTIGNTANAVANGIIDTFTSVTIIVPPITNNPRPSITGTCETGANIIIKITVGANNTLLQTLPSFVCVGGTYSVNPTIDIPQGAYCARADATDIAGNTAFAQGCGDIFVTVSVPEITTENKPEIVGTCTPSVNGGFQVPVIIEIKVGSGFNTTNETISTVCTTAGTYRVRPNIIIPVGPFQVTATATDAIGNQAVAVDTGVVVRTVAPVNSPGGTIIITTSAPEVFENISDPYECGKSIIGQVTSNYGIRSIVVKLFTLREDGSYEYEPKYIFRPIVDSQGKYIINLSYSDEKILVKGNYKIEYSTQSNTGAIKSGSYLANVTDQCDVKVPVIIAESAEITPEGKITIRTGGGNETLLIISILTLTIGIFGYLKLRKKYSTAAEVFGK
jgi:large repetitive protein